MNREVSLFVRRGYTTITDLLPFLKGRPLDDISLAYIQSLRPTRVETVKYRQGSNADSYLWRVRVHLDKDGMIHTIHQEVEVGLPEGIHHSLDMSRKMTERDLQKRHDALQSKAIQEHFNLPK